MIKIEQYQLEPSIHSLGWDLKVEHERVDKEKKKNIILKDLSYDMPLEWCLRKIIHEEIRMDNSITTPEKFLKSFEELSNKFIKIIKGINVEK